MSTTGHESEAVNVKGLKRSLKKEGNIAIFNDVVCSTAGATAEKVTDTVPKSFTLTNKAKILVKFTYGISVDGATLQVGENAAKPIFFLGSALKAGLVRPGMHILLQYDGTNFNIVGDITKIDGYYKSFHAGMADNIFGETETNDVFTDRTTAGWQDVADSEEANFGSASIIGIKGNAVPWYNHSTGNFSKISSSQTITITNNADGSTTVTKTGSSTCFAKIGNNVSNGSTDKFYCRARVKVSKTGGTIVFGNMNSGGTAQSSWSATRSNINTTGYVDISFISTASINLNTYGNIGVKATGLSTGDSMTISSIMLLNLTVMFGSGNEPSKANFEAWLNKNVGYSDIRYPQQLGALLPAKSFTLTSEGFNAYSNGTARVLLGKQYQITGSYTSITLNGNTITPDEDGFFTPSVSGTGFGNINPVDGTLVIEGGGSDTCVHLVWSGGRNGDYATYWKQTKTIPITTIEGKLNGAGSNVVIFPDGMKKDGDVCDEIKVVNGVTKAIKRVGSQTITGAIGDTITLTGCSLSATTFTCASNIGTLSGGVLTLTAAASDVDVYYELATPLEYTVTNFEMPVDYKVDDYGTEELNLGNTSSVVSCAPIMDIKYGINAPDTIKNLPVNYVSVHEQEFTTKQKKQARDNIGIVTKNAAAYGFLPTSSASDNVAALQDAVEGGGTVIVDVPGTYYVNDTVTLDSNTALIFGAGVTVAIQGVVQEGTTIYKRFLINKGAYTRTYNSNITVQGLNLSVNTKNITTDINGLRGYIAFFYVKNLVIDNFTLLDGGAGTFVIHICTFEDIKLTNIHIEGDKDGIHLGRGKRFLIRDCEFKTNDDPLAFNARDYEDANPEFGWIENGLVENITELGGINKIDGFFCRMLGGSWLDWASGNSYQKNGDVCVNDGKLYITVGPLTTNTSISTVAPSCGIGEEETIGELTWRCVQESDGVYNCGCRNITFKDIRILQEREMAFHLDISNNKYTRCFYPGSTPPSQDNMVFDNITAVNLSNALVVAKTPANVIKIVNSRFVGRGTYLSGGSGFFGSDCPPYHILWSNLTFAHASGNKEVIRNAAGCPGDLKVIGSVQENSGFVAKKAVSNFTVTSDITITAIS